MQEGQAYRLASKAMQLPEHVDFPSLWPPGAFLCTSFAHLAMQPKLLSIYLPRRLDGVSDLSRPESLQGLAKQHLLGIPAACRIYRGTGNHKVGLMGLVLTFPAH
eukprot:1143852-Pelagomonas_calceolata.AAC.3